MTHTPSIPTPQAGQRCWEPSPEPLLSPCPPRCSLQRREEEGWQLLHDPNLQVGVSGISGKRQGDCGLYRPQRNLEAATVPTLQPEPRLWVNRYHSRSECKARKGLARKERRKVLTPLSWSSPAGRSWKPCSLSVGHVPLPSIICGSWLPQQKPKPSQLTRPHTSESSLPPIHPPWPQPPPCPSPVPGMHHLCVLHQNVFPDLGFWLLLSLKGAFFLYLFCGSGI
jgi:hypothetical protein